MRSEFVLVNSQSVPMKASPTSAPLGSEPEDSVSGLRKHLVIAVLTLMAVWEVIGACMLGVAVCVRWHLEVTHRSSLTTPENR